MARKGGDTMNKKARKLLIVILQFQTEEEMKNGDSSENFKKQLRNYRRLLVKYYQLRMQECIQAEREGED